MQMIKVILGLFIICISTVSYADDTKPRPAIVTIKKVFRKDGKIVKTEVIGQKRVEDVDAFCKVNLGLNGC